MGRTVLILARDFDAQVDRLVEELGTRGVPVFRTDLADFPQRLRLTATLEDGGWAGKLENDVRAVDLGDIAAVWYRHPSHFAVSEKMTRPEQRHAAAEARAAIAGVLGSLDVRWVNHPAREADAVKPLQLGVARRCGFAVPETVVSNTEAGVRRFIGRVDGPIASKNLSPASLVESNRIATAFTRRLLPRDLHDLRGVEATAHMFQRFIDDKAYEVRATVVGSRVFAAAIHTRSAVARIDFRADYVSHEYTIVEPPEQIRVAIVDFMREFDLAFGAFDFGVTADGEWIFFECNPFGQYGWIEDELGFPITSAIADLLTGTELPPAVSRDVATGTEVRPSATDLDDEEIVFARRRLTEMDAEFAEAGAVRNPRLRAVFRQTWRHPYVPAYYPDKDSAPILCIDPVRRQTWLDAVYSDVTLLTKVDHVPLSRAFGPATGTVFASSTTLPSLMLGMLDHLDLVPDGVRAPRVLEIGTGTGYNAALLCALLDSRSVTSVDIDPDLIDLARERLAANGHHPTLAALDGSNGYPGNAPYDRIVATCAVDHIPAAWLHQSAPGAVILADVHGPIGGTLVRLSVDRGADDRPTATGRFVSYLTGFMALRGAAAVTYPRTGFDDPDYSWTDVDPNELTRPGSGFAFVAQWHLPSTTYGRLATEYGSTLVLHATDGSRAEIGLTPSSDGRYPVRSEGPRRLVDDLELAARFWIAHDEPAPDRFGLTVTPAGQVVWFDDPADGPRWELPVPGARQG